jgi:hypothetical protein
MSHSSITTQLEQVELQVAQVSETLLDMSLGDLPQVCKSMQAAIVDFSKLVQQLPNEFKTDQPLQLRLRKVSASLTSCRESLIRRSVITQQALGALVPATRSDTYAPAAGPRSSKTDGSAGRQSGEFRTVSA